ncbi:hypothetical protein QFZ79_001708 [Arthrobacter sp. V4I6]|nr:hypothetical protein [Arthrobacter sp. V1I7]MDQ0853597.1 hypothetical protein [Arthrobacter sp. V4I6]
MEAWDSAHAAFDAAAPSPGKTKLGFTRLPVTETRKNTPLGRAAGSRISQRPAHLTPTKNKSPYATGVPETSNLVCPAPAIPTVSIVGQK